jgi:two-component system, LuxR family, sensor histidine kinase DctS
VTAPDANAALAGMRQGSRWLLARSRDRRSLLWAALFALLLALLGTLVWLAGRYESSQMQSRLDRDAADTLADIRSGLTRNVQSLQALLPADRTSQAAQAWMAPAAELLREQREMVRIEWRGPNLAVRGFVDTPYRAPVFARLGRDAAQADVGLACSTARRTSGAAYSSSYFVPQSEGLGFEMVDMCLPVMSAGTLAGHLVATYALQEVLAELVGKQLVRGRALAFTEADGTRLALHGLPTGGSRLYVSQQLLDLPGNTLVLRLESRVGMPALFPNVLTALVTAMSLALLGVLLLLARDTRKRMQVEHDLGEALAFRKAMEDSVLTGLRARDLTGRITYVNPAFCQMVGIEAKTLLEHRFPAPYWPPELVDTYQQRQNLRLAGNALPREGMESLFIRPDGTRFPVLIMEAPLINAVGKHTGWMSAILDVSEQRRVEELSRASQDRLQATARLAMMGEMASLLSHELNQPLAAISSYATGSLNLLKEQSPLLAGAGAAHGAQSAFNELPGELSDDLQIAMGRIAAQAERAGKVIKSVHDFVRRREQAREAVEPRLLLDAIMPLLGLQAKKLSVAVAIDIDAACAPVWCDRTMVEQVLLNLSRNGMQAMQPQAAPPSSSGSAYAMVPQERLLTLRVRPVASKPRSQWMEFAVIDRGDGISPEVAQQLFTPFFTTKVEGMGLGLSLCRTVIEQHGGSLGFEAVEPRGTIFSFTLPVAPGTAADPLN